MSTYLQLCQAVARDSGTVADLTQPSTVSSQTGRLLRIVNWVNDALEMIESARTDWAWLRTRFTAGPLLATVQSYDASAMGISSRFNHWIFEGEKGEETFSIYKNSDGQANEGFLEYVPWERFRREFLVGSQVTTTGTPVYVTVAPDQKLWFWPTPDAAHTVQGEYYKSPQTLSGDADVPDLPAAHHSVIKWRALMLMGVLDEATVQIPAWELFYTEQMAALERKFTPRIQLTGPLA